jgi:hypothetical protein
MAWFWDEDQHAERWSGGPYRSREDAIADARRELGLEAEFYVAEGTQSTPDHYMPDAEDVLGWAREQACDDAGESAEEFGDCSDEAEAELTSLLAAWANKYLEVTFWSIDPSSADLVTADDNVGAGEGE